MRQQYTRFAVVGAVLAMVLCGSFAYAAGPSIGGFIPFVGMGMTNEFKTIDSLDLGDAFFISDPEFELNLAPGKMQLGQGGTPYYEIALLDTGAATHILAPAAHIGFDIVGAGLQGTNSIPVGGATGTINMQINDAAGVYIAGMADRVSAGSNLVMNTSALKGQSSFATLSAPAEWTLPSIIGLPMAMHHSIVIRNDQPQVFELDGRTVRTPQVDLIEVGTGGDQGILRRAALDIRPGIGFVQGPFYVYNLDFSDIFNANLDFHDNPASPTVVQDQTGTGGSLFLDVDLKRSGFVREEREFLFDTGADLTVISQHMAKRLGFDAILDTPDFVLEVEGSGGVLGGVPGIFLDELNIVTVGGDFTVYNVPVAVLDVTDVSDPGNVLDGIIGTHLFNGRNLVIDAKPSIGGGGAGPSLYISDPVTTDHVWTSTAAAATWHVGSRWSTASVPDLLATTQVANVSGSHQIVRVAQDAVANTLTVSGTATANMTLEIEPGATLTTFGETKIEAGGVIDIAAGATLDTQFVNIEGGVLTGSGNLFSGTGPITTPVRNIAGRIEPGDDIGILSIDGDFSNLVDATLAIELGGTTAGSQYDQLTVTRNAFLGGELEVSLANLGGGVFAPSVGDTFTVLIADQGVQGMFDSLALPGGYAWDVIYNTNDVVLSVAALVELLPGDFNADGVVNAADYTLWRDGLGSEYTMADYAIWKNHFGQTAAGAGLAAAAVPEPASFALGLLLMAGWIARSCRRPLCNVSCLLVLLASPAAAESVFRSYHIGNSLTWDMQVVNLANRPAPGFDAAETGYHIRGASSLDQIIDHPDSIGTPEPSPFGNFSTALPGYDWHAVTLQPHSGNAGTELAAGAAIIDMARERPVNADTKFYVYASWPQGALVDGTPTIDFQEKWLATHDYGADEPMYRERGWYYWFVAELRETVPDAEVNLIPVGDVWLALDEKFRDGVYPGIEEASQLYRDNIHANNVGRYAAQVTAWVVMHQTSPMVLEWNDGFAATTPGNHSFDILPTEALSNLIRATVWDVVSGHPLTGVAQAGDFNSNDVVDAAN